jgi:hypothetical protein
MSLKAFAVGLAVIPSLLIPAGAQDFRGGPPQGGPQGQPFQQPNPNIRGLQVAPSGFQIGPTAPDEFKIESNLRALLRRPEVQSEIGLDLKQRNAMIEAEEGGANAIRKRIDDAMQGRDAQFRTMSFEQRRAWMQRQQADLAAQVQAGAQSQGDLDPKVRQILRPEQLSRLLELDLQKRGPLALGDARVGQELKLSPQSRVTEARIQAEYQAAMRTIVTEAMQTALQNGDVSKGNMPDFESRLSPVRKKLDANKKSAEKRALEALSPEEAEAWAKAQGEPFTFRADRTPQKQRQPTYRR